MNTFFHGLGQRRRVLFSGDIGNAGRPLLPPPSPPAASDFVVIGSTYGDRLHRPYAESIEELYSAITATFARRGNVISRHLRSNARRRSSSSFAAVSRRAGCRHPWRCSSICRWRSLRLNSSKRHSDCYSANLASLLADGGDPFDFPNLHFSREPAESIAINRISGRTVIMAGSGMCTGGRIRHYLRQNLRPEAGIIFAGFAAQGTLGRRIIEGAPHHQSLW